MLLTLQKAILRLPKTASPLTSHTGRGKNLTGLSSGMVRDLY